MKDDLISRQAAVYAIVNTVSAVGLHDNSETARYGATYRQQEIITILKSLPSAEPQWIPCSERLPSEGEYVLVTEKWNGYVRMWRLQYIDNEPTWEADGYNVDIDEAVAWMPLPKPYREEGNNETD